MATDWQAKATKLRADGKSYGEIASAVKKNFYAVKGYLQSTVEKIDKAQEKRNESLLRSLEKARAPRVKIVSAPAILKAEDFSRITVPDTHGSKIDHAAAGALLADIESIKPKQIVLLGDHMDCGGFLAQHHTMGYVAETEYSFEDDVAAANQFLDELQSKAPGAEIFYLEGNHERRIERWCVTQTLANRKDADFLRRMFSTESVLSLEKRGIRFFKQGQFYDGLRVPSTIKLGKCHFTHGSRAGVNAAMQTLNDFGGNVVFAHTHRADSAVKRTVGSGEIGAYNPGCLCQLQPLWQHTQITGWSHGYGLQLVRKSGAFLHINVPIIDGKSLMIPLTRRVA